MNEKKVAFVTGASRGIGAAIAQRLAKDGFHVVAVARTQDKLEALCNEINAQGGTAPGARAPSRPRSTSPTPRPSPPLWKRPPMRTAASTASSTTPALPATA